MMYFTEDVLKFTLYIKNKSAAGRVQPAGSSQPQGSAAYQGGGGNLNLQAFWSWNPDVVVYLCVSTVSFSFSLNLLPHNQLRHC